RDAVPRPVRDRDRGHRGTRPDRSGPQDLGPHYAPPMTISGLYDLLEVQKIDLEIDRLLDRRQSLPELAEYRKTHELIQTLEARHGEAAEQLRDLERQVDKAEGELSILEA